MTKFLITCDKIKTSHFHKRDVVFVASFCLNNGCLYIHAMKKCYDCKLKQRLKAEGNETVTNCHALKMLAPDGKNRLTDVADMSQLFRLIQSIPSKKAEPFKRWTEEASVLF